MRIKFVYLVLLSLILPMLITGFQTKASITADPVTLNGSGASFPAPLIEKWADLFYDATGELVTVNYGSGGSGKGIADTKAFAVDFAGSDAPFTVSDKTDANGTVLHIPETLGAVVVTYNLPTLSEALVLDGETIAKIFQRNITNWNDAAISDLNPGVNLPSTDIIVAHRSDSSGTTFAFTDFLDRSSEAWILGTAKSIDWDPNTQAGAKNDGVASIVSTTENAIGYVELGYAESNSNLAIADIKNKDGNTITPSALSVSAAASAAASNLPTGEGNWDDVSIANLDGADVYPISTFTYILVYEDLTDPKTNMGVRGAALIAWLTFMVSDEAQEQAEPLGYAPLPQAAIDKAKETINKVVYDTSISPDDYYNPNLNVPGFEIGFLLLGLVFLTPFVKKSQKD